MTPEIKYIIECEVADRPGEWGGVDYPRNEERAQASLADWAGWIKTPENKIWRAVRLVKQVTTREVVSLANPHS